MPQEFADLAERIVDALLKADPRIANTAGDHRSDGVLPDFTSEAITARVAMLRDAGDALAQVDVDSLDAEDTVDHAQLSSLIDQHLFELAVIREYEWNPLLHSPGPLLYALLSRDFAPASERLDSLADRMSAIPDALSTARRILTDCPAVHREAALTQFAGVVALIRDEVPKLLTEAPELGPQVDGAREDALKALAEFDAWLRADSGEPGRDPRLGRRLWEGRLWYTLDTGLTSAQLFRRAEEALDQVSAELVEV
nr:DUF885 family protein [Longispora sp. (in: high G+C Gram-positive bacteria)]